MTLFPSLNNNPVKIKMDQLRQNSPKQTSSQTSQDSQNNPPDYEALYNEQLEENKKLMQVLRNLVMTTNPVIALVSTIVSGAKEMALPEIMGKVSKMVLRVTKDKGQTPVLVHVGKAFGHEISHEEGKQVMEQAVKAGSMLSRYAEMFAQEESQNPE